MENECLHDWIIIDIHRIFNAFYDTVKTKIPFVQYHFQSHFMCARENSPGSYRGIGILRNPDLIIDFYVDHDSDYKHLVHCVFAATHQPNDDIIVIDQRISTEMDDLVALPRRCIPLPITPDEYRLALGEALEEMDTLLKENHDKVVHELLTADWDRQYMG